MTMKFDAITRYALIQIIVEAKKSDETLEAVNKIENLILVPRDKRCKECLKNSGVICDVEGIPEAK